MHHGPFTLLLLLLLVLLLLLLLLLMTFGMRLLKSGITSLLISWCSSKAPLGEPAWVRGAVRQCTNLSGHPWSNSTGQPSNLSGQTSWASLRARKHRAQRLVRRPNLALVYWCQH